MNLLCFTAGLHSLGNLQQLALFTPAYTRGGREDISAHVGWKDGVGDRILLVVRAAVSTSCTEAMANAGMSTGTKYIYA